jgi:hypothetical protein
MAHCLPVARPESALVDLTAAVRALAEYHSIPDVRDVRDKAAAIGRYLRQQRYGLQAQNEAAELKLRAERRLGELLAETVDHGGDRRSKSHRTTLNGLPEGVSKTQSSRWQRIARVPLRDFEKYVKDVKDSGEELTTAGLLDLAKSLEKDRTRRRRLRDARKFAQTYRPGEDMGVITGDMAALEDRLEDGSVDLVLSDPPFGHESVPLYGRLAALGARKLRPGGLCLAYCGKLYLPDVFKQMGQHLVYWWEFAIRFNGLHYRAHARGVQEHWRPIVAFAKPPVRPAPEDVSDLLQGGGRVKGLHPWQQPETEAHYLIRHLTEPGGLVVDPFAGSGTTCAAAQATGRRWLATEVDADTAAVARRRLGDTSLPSGRPGDGG